MPATSRGARSRRLGLCARRSTHRRSFRRVVYWESTSVDLAKTVWWLVKQRGRCSSRRGKSCTGEDPARMRTSPIEISNGVPATTNNGDVVDCGVCHRAMLTDDVGGNFFTTDEC